MVAHLPDQFPTVLVTGATGFVGRPLVASLLSRGAEVRVLTRNAERVPAEWLGHVGVALGDVLDAASLDAAVAGADTVFHLAGEIRDESAFESVNHQGTLNLLRACVASGATRFIHLSSVGVIGASRPGRYDESSECHPQNAYEWSKLSAERAVLEAPAAGSLAVTVLRPTIVFGPRRGSAPDSFVGWLRAIQSGRFRFIGRGDAVANYVYVEDVAASCLAVAGDPGAVGEIYHVADAAPLRDFVGHAATLLGVSPPGSLPAWVAYPAAVGLERLGRLVGFSSPLTLARVKALTSRALYAGDKLAGVHPLPYGWREGLRRTILAYRESGVLG